LPTLLGAQDLIGTWQGTLKIPARDLRVVFKISRNPADEKLTGQFFSIDQGGQALPLGAVTAQGSAVRIKIDAIGGTYEGTFAADGNTINGTFTQGQPIAMALARATPSTTWSIPEPPPPPKRMDPKADPAFEVATIKPSAAGGRGRGFTLRGSEIITINTTVEDLINFGFSVHQRQITGGPDWVRTDHFDITGKADVPGTPNIDQFRSLIRKLLADRFQLKFHQEKKELAVYAITTIPGVTPKLILTANPSATPSLIFPRLGLLPARSATLEEFAAVMQGAVLDRPVVNQTKLDGRYDFTLDWAPDEYQFASFGPIPKQPESDKPDLNKAFQEELGLKLTTTKAVINTVAIDSAAKPEN